MASNPAAGWYPDPENSSLIRWWNGISWSSEVMQAPVSHEPSFAPAGSTGNGFAQISDTNAYPGAFHDSGYRYQQQSSGVPTKVTLINSVKYAFGGYVKWNGRATRAEYWFFYLAYTLVSLVVQLMIMALGTDSGPGLVFSLLVSVASLALVLPLISLTVRRLHDTGRRAWYMVLSIVGSFIGGMLISVFLLIAAVSPDNYTGSVTSALTGAGIVFFVCAAWWVFMFVLMVLPTKKEVTQWDDGYRPSVGQF
jgi:uncharacterized membrane protein YhaH (DUF805 family)